MQLSVHFAPHTRRSVLCRSQITRTQDRSWHTLLLSSFVTQSVPGEHGYRVHRGVHGCYLHGPRVWAVDVGVFLVCIRLGCLVTVCDTSAAAPGLTHDRQPSRASWVRPRAPKRWRDLWRADRAHWSSALAWVALRPRPSSARPWRRPSAAAG